MRLIVVLNYYLVCFLVSSVFGNYSDRYYDQYYNIFYNSYYDENYYMEYASYGQSEDNGHQDFVLSPEDEPYLLHYFGLSPEDESYLLHYGENVTPEHGSDSFGEEQVGPVEDGGTDETVLLGIPASYDWRVDYGFNVVPPPEAQGNCYSCWIFGAIYMLEAQYAIKTGKAVSFSKQQIMDCLKDKEMGGCYGMGSVKLLLEYVKKASLQTTESYGPYLDLVDTCHYDPKKVSLGVTGEHIAFSGHEDLLRAVYHRGPIVVMIQSYWQQTYNGGILSVKGEQCKVESGSPINHLVLLVGYGKNEHGKKYWIAKNTYGTGWGLDGYFKIERGRNTLCVEHLGWVSKILLPL